MRIKAALHPFKKRLISEAWIRSAVLAGMIAACIATLLGIVHVIIPWLVTELWVILAFLGVFAIGFGLVFLILYRPSKRDIAKRLDGLGMAERVETMLEFADSATPAARLQREDTITRLQSIRARDLRIRVSKTLTALCAVFTVTAVVLLLIPEVNAFSRHPIVNELNQIIRDGNISDEFREDLEEILDELDEDLENSENDGDREQAMNDAMNKIDESVDKENSHKDLGGMLQRYDDLKELGEAIAQGDKEGVSEALEQLKEEMSQNPEKQESVAEQLQDALDKAGENSDADPENDLWEALENMKDGLQDPTESAEETLDRAEDEIGEALDQQQNAEKVGQQMKEELENAKPSGSGEGSQDQPGSSGEGEQPNGGDQQGAGAGGGSGEGSGSDSGGGGDGGFGSGYQGSTHMKDKVVDPVAGQVQFGDVYATYVADFLARAEAGELSESVVEAMNQYLEQLKDQHETGRK